jgi:Ni/Fe-hydrogenase subunit HybB-like protein
MHQSSLGTVMLLAGHKLHPLWNTGWIPLLFLVSCIGMGYAVVVWESTISSRAFKRDRHAGMLKSLGGAMVVTLVAFVVIRLADIVLSGKAAMLFNQGWLSLLFWVEIALFLVPAWMLMGAKQKSFQNLLNASILMMLGGAIYRFDTYIVAYNPGENWNYFPSIPELFITFGVIALEIALYIFIVKRYPILAGEPAARSAS